MRGRLGGLRPGREKARSAERGQMVVFVALFVPVLLLMAGLSVDVGIVLTQRTQAQTAADAAALAAAIELLQGGSAADAIAEAQATAADNGFEDGVNGTEVTVSVPPTSGDRAGDSNFVEVTVHRDIPMLFMSLVVEETPVGARAVAGVIQAGGLYAIIVLDEDAARAYEHTGSGDLTITGGGGIMVNSDDSRAIFKSGSGDINVEPGPIHYYFEGDLHITGSGSVNPWPSSRSTRVEDPLAVRDPPVPGSPAPGSDGIPENPQLTHLMGSGDRTIYPGTYYGGLKISGSGHTTMESGVYVMAGGGFEYSGSGGVTGDGVLIYNTDDPVQPAGAGAFGRIDIAGSGSFDVTAPEPGPGQEDIQDMLIWQDPDNTQQMRRQGSGNLGAGIIYLPSAELYLAGSGSVGSLQIVVNTFVRTGSGNVTIPFQAYVEVSEPSIALVE